MDLKTSESAGPRVQSLVLWAFGLTLACSLALLVLVVYRSKVNVLSMATILVSVGSSGVAVLARSRLGLIVAITGLTLAILPALIGGLGLIYTPSLLLLMLAFGRRKDSDA